MYDYTKVIESGLRAEVNYLSEALLIKKKIENYMNI